MMRVPSNYVVFKRLDQIGAEERPVVLVFLANADQMSALVVMANYTHGGSQNAIIPAGSFLERDPWTSLTGSTP